MEDWNFKQVTGFALMCVGGLFVLIGGLMLLFMVLKLAVAITILFSIILLSGLWLWRSGSKKNNKKIENMTPKQKEMIKLWFDHIKQMATDRKTINGVIMEDALCLDEIRALAHNASEFVGRFWNNKDAWEV